MKHHHFEHAEKVHQELEKVEPKIPVDHKVEQAKASIAAAFPELDEASVDALASKGYSFIPGHWEVTAGPQADQSTTSILD